MSDKDNGQCRVFVYGTLKKNNCNNVVLRGSNAVFMGRDYIEGPWTLGIMGGLPAVFDAGDENNRVYGETWMGDEGMLAACDLLECHPTWYKREKVLSARLEKRVWIYIMQDTWDNVDVEWPDSGMYNPSSQEKKFWKQYNG